MSARLFRVAAAAVFAMMCAIPAIVSAANSTVQSEDFGQCVSKCVQRTDGPQRGRVCVAICRAGGTGGGGGCSGNATPCL